MGPTVRPRTVGLKKVDLSYGHLHEIIGRNAVKSPMPPPVRPRTPDDLNAPPLGSSSEPSGDEDPDFEEVHPAKRRKTEGNGGPDAIKSRSSPPTESRSAAGSQVCEPSNLAPATFVSTRKSSKDSDEEGPFSSQARHGRSSQLRKTYGGSKHLPNIHTAPPKTKQRKKVEKSPKSTSKARSNTFIVPGAVEVWSAEEDAPSNNDFMKPPSEETARARRATKRLSSNITTSPEVKHSAPLKGLQRTEREQFSHTKETKPFVQPPKQLRISNEFGTEDMQAATAQTVDKRTGSAIPIRHPEVSIMASSIPSAQDDATSSSELSTPPSSPGVEIIVDPSKTVCPVCKMPVDREFLEEFNNGKRLKSRQQLKFCNAHKARSAKAEWGAKGYPEIDWSNFDERLQKYHSVIDGIVKEKRPSFYRSIYEDQMNQSKFTTMKNIYRDTGSAESPSPGYYGSRGARAISENLTSAFASKVRRRATSDKAIHIGGVAAYIQAVLAPELAVLLVMEDMKTNDQNARAILKDSTDIGNLLNEEEDDVIHLEEEVGDPFSLAIDA